MSTEELETIQWIDFATVKRWKKQLTVKSKQGELADGTWNAVKSWFPRIIKATGKTSDELIEEALVDPEIGEERLFETFKWCKKMDTRKTLQSLEYLEPLEDSTNTIKSILKDGVLQLQNLSSRAKRYQLSNVCDYEKSKKLDLNRPLIQSFFRKINPRDELIGLCLILTGLDDGDLLELTVGFVRNQDAQFKRLFLVVFREKTAETESIFQSRGN